MFRSRRQVRGPQSCGRNALRLLFVMLSCLLALSQAAKIQMSTTGEECMAATIAKEEVEVRGCSSPLTRGNAGNHHESRKPPSVTIFTTCGTHADA
jgi:hypothetical protein